MTTFKKIMSLLMTAALMCTVVMLAACGTEENSDPQETTYKVTVKDALGNPYSSGIVVKLFKNGEQIAMQACDGNGIAEKTLPSGEYTAELAFTDNASYYYKDLPALTSEANEIEVIMARKISSDPHELFAGSNSYDAYPVSEGCTYVELTTDDRNYFLFTPSESGNYEFSVIDGTNVGIGYYGAPHFVQESSVAEVVDNAFTVSVSASMIGTGNSGTSVFVIGVDALDADAESCVIAIKRIGNAEKTLEDEPWTVYEATAELSAYQLPADAQIQEFDLTASTDTYDLVYNDEDGFYHLDSENGQLVLVRLAEDTDYIACFKTMLDRSGVVKYFFDESGAFVKKESYSECLLEYIKYADESEGVYPLTEDLKYIIQQRGDYSGWWDIEGGGYLFKDANGNNRTDINNEIAWLLMCCYIE